MNELSEYSGTNFDEEEEFKIGSRAPEGLKGATTPKKRKADEDKEHTEGYPAPLVGTEGGRREKWPETKIKMPRTI